MSTFDVTSALTLVIPSEYVDKINEIRSKQDKAYPRWMPHINFLFPFVEEHEFDDVTDKLEKALSEFNSFEITLNTIGSFAQGKNLTVHISPPPNEANVKLQELFKVIRATLPYVQVKHNEFHPHLTIAQIPKAGADKALNELVTWLGSGFTFKVDKICILKRPRDDNTIGFSVSKTISLKP